MANPTNTSYSTPTGDLIYAGVGSEFQGLLTDIMPSAFDVGLVTDTTTVEIRLDGGGSERSELGLFDEWTCEWEAIFRNAGDAVRAEVLRTYMVGQANSIKGFTWDDLAILSGETNPTTSGSGDIETSYAHFPNVFFPAALLTNNSTERDEFIQAARDKHTSANDHFSNTITAYWKDEQQRGWAWALREIAQLAYLEREGLITGTGTYYRDILEANKTHIELVIAMNETSWDHAIVPQIYKTMYTENNRAGVNWRRSGWQQAFIGMTIAYINKLGFDWMAIANFHVQHWGLRRDNWGWESVDYDYCYIDDAIAAYDALATQPEKDAFDWWSNVVRADYISDGSNTGVRDAALTNASWNSALIVDTVIDGEQMTFNGRLDMLLSCMAMYVDIGAIGASTFLSQLKTQRQDRINRGGASDYSAYRHSLEWRD